MWFKITHNHFTINKGRFYADNNTVYIKEFQASISQHTNSIVINYYLLTKTLVMNPKNIYV